MNQSLETIERRINALGLTEPTISVARPQGQRNSSCNSPAKAIRNAPRPVIQAWRSTGIDAACGSDAVSFPISRIGQIRRNFAAEYGVAEGAAGIATFARIRNDTSENWYLVQRPPAVTGRDLRSATGKPQHGYARAVAELTLCFRTKPRNALVRSPSRTGGRQMAIVLEHQVYSAPTIQSRIEDQGPH